MSRLSAMILAVALLAGCKGSTALAPIDPFSRKTVAPPRTGAVGIRPPDGSYYGGSPDAAAPVTSAPSGGSGAASSAAPPAIRSGYEPPGGRYDLRKDSKDETPRPVAAVKPGDRVTIPLAARDFSGRSRAALLSTRAESSPNSLRNRETNSAVAAPSAAATAGSPNPSSVALAGASENSPITGREKIVRTIEPRSASADVAPFGDTPTPAAAQPAPRRLSSPGAVINIMDLPPARASHTSQSSSGSDRVRLVSRNDSSVPAKVDAFSARPRYAHDPNYGWLRGRLEHSQIDRRWKLRYIPIDGRTDDFGGSVVIADASVLAGYERGDFVEIHGQLGPTAADKQHYAPEFEVHQIKGPAD